MEQHIVDKCAEKMSFDTKKEAQTAATVATHQRGMRLTPYKCTTCELWHNATKYEE